MSSAIAPVTVTPTVTAPAAAAADSDTGFSFDDLIDIVNPLQHIPIVGTIYRAITGDKIKDFPKVAGDTLFGGPEGFVSSVADLVFTKITGKSVGDTVLGWAEDIVSPSKPAATGVAANTAAAPAAASISTPAGEDLGDRIVNWFHHLFSGSHADSTAAAATAAAPTPSVPAPGTLPVSVTAIRPPAPLQTSAVAPQPADAIIVPGQDELLMALNRSGVGQDVALRAADAYRRTLNIAGAAAALH